jgi:predicted amidophosphoribosyltransferase
MAKDCLYCRLQFSDSTKFCPNCGRPTESGFKVRPMQESELDRLRRKMKGKDNLRPQQGFYSGCSSPLAHKDCLYCGLQFPDTTKFCPDCGRPTESGFIIRPMQESKFGQVTPRKGGSSKVGDQLIGGSKACSKRKGAAPE